MALMNSFYGGRRGASFVIVKNYLDVVTMTADFARGNDFTEVNYDEYVMINNPNKNHPDNGKIFRRGYDYNSKRTLNDVTVLCDSDGNQYTAGLTEEDYKNLKQGDYFEEGRSLEAHGAEYIGCVVGPAGKAPLLSIGAYEDVEDKQADPLKSRKGFGEYRPNGTHPGLIPGKEGNTFHDAIEWCYTSIRNDNYGDATQAFIGFKFPYLVTQMETQMVEPYAPENNYKGKVIAKGNYTDTSEIHKKILTEENGVIKEIFDYQLEENQEEILHPYYNKWHLNIPKGVKGDTLKNLKVTTFNSYQEGNSSADKTAIYRLYKDDNNGKWQEEQLLGGNEINYTFFKNHYNFTDEQLKENQEYIPANLYNLLEDKQILVYEVINYDNKQEGQKKYYYLGDYNQIKDISLEDGILKIEYTNQDTENFIMKSIQNIRLGLKPNNQQQELENSLSEGQLEITYTTKESNSYDFEKEIFQIPWVSSIQYAIDEETGLVNLQYTLAGSEEPKTIMRNLKNIKNITSLPSGGIKIIYQGDYSQDFPLKTIANISTKRNYLLPKYERDSRNRVIHYKYTNDENIEEGTEVQIDSETIKYTKTQALDGKPVPLINSQTHEQQTQVVTGIVVTYVNGQQELVTNNQTFNFLEKFEYNEQDGKFTIKEFKDENQKNLYINYVNSILWDEDNNRLKYSITGNPNQSSQITQQIDIPFIQQLDITDNLDFFVRFSNAYHNKHRRTLVGQEPSWDNINDEVAVQMHPQLDGWYYLGNLFKTNVFGNINLFEIGLNYNYNNLLSEVNNLPDSYNALKERFSRISEYTEETGEIILAVLNALYPQGIGNEGPSGGLISYGQQSEIKSLYGYSPATWNEEGTTILSGGWFFLGSSASQRQFLQVGESASTLADGGYLLKTTNDICSITVQDERIILSNPMKLIKLGASYTTNISPLSSGSIQIIMSGNDITNSCCQDGKTVNISSVLGDLSFRIIT